VNCTKSMECWRNWFESIQTVFLTKFFSDISLTLRWFWVKPVTFLSFACFPDKWSPCCEPQTFEPCSELVVRADDDVNETPICQQRDLFPVEVSISRFVDHQEIQLVSASTDHFSHSTVVRPFHVQPVHLEPYQRFVIIIIRGVHRSSRGKTGLLPSPLNFRLLKNFLVRRFSFRNRKAGAENLSF